MSRTVYGSSSPVALRSADNPVAATERLRDSGRVAMEDIYSETFWRLFDDLDTSLDPPGPDQLHAIAEPYLTRGGRVLDIGCRDARHLIELVRRHDLHGVGVDPVPWHLTRAREAVDAAGFTDRITIRAGRAEQLPDPDGWFDAVWCRDVLEVLPDLSAAMTELRRVLRTGGHLIAYTTVAAEVSPAEAATVHEPLGNVVANLDEHRLEQTFAGAGFAVTDKQVIGTRWREHLEERERVVSRDLLRLARLRRRETEIRERYGAEAFAIAQASLQWSTLQFLGRLVPVVYVLSAVG